MECARSAAPMPAGWTNRLKCRRRCPQTGRLPELACTQLPEGIGIPTRDEIATFLVNGGA